VRIETIGDATLYLGDCMEVMPTLGRVDAVLTDPPYGINAARDRNSEANGWVDYGAPGWDQERPGREIFDAIIACSKHQIIWGGNYFTDYLPPTMQWLVWDKGQRNFSLADGEFAWSSQQKAARIFNYPRIKAMADGKEHPTQKPIALMAWCLGFVKDARTILDPFMGSGTTGVACAKAGRTFIGIEREPTYFDIACRRIEQAYAQPDMFVAPPANDNAPAADMFAA
jgi:DNA modification methylase